MSPSSRQRDSKGLVTPYLVEVDGVDLVGHQEEGGTRPVPAFDLCIHSVALGLNIECQRVGFLLYITDQIKVHISFLLWCEENINWETDRETRQQIN